LSAIHDLATQVTNPRLRERTVTEWACASKEKKFGLVFGDHLSELLSLLKARPRRCLSSLALTACQIRFHCERHRAEKLSALKEMFCKALALPREPGPPTATQPSLAAPRAPTP